MTQYNRNTVYVTVSLYYNSYRYQKFSELYDVKSIQIT